jgi:hypothetical protein
MNHIIYMTKHIFLTSSKEGCLQKFRKSIKILVCMLSLGIWGGPIQAQLDRQVGVSLGASYLSGNNGFIFDSDLIVPHRDYGVTAGLTFFVPLERDLHLTLGGLLNYELSHFHAEIQDLNEMVTVYYHYGFLQVPILLNHSGRAKKGQPFVLKEFFGFAFNFGNLFQDPNEGFLDDGERFTYRTRMRQRWEINPEFVIGLGLVSRQGALGRFHYSLSMHLDVARNQLFEASIFDREENQRLVADREMRGIKAMLMVTYYPQFNIRRKACYRN